MLGSTAQTAGSSLLLGVRAAVPEADRRASGGMAVAGRQARLLSRNYTLAAVASVLPFLLLVVMLAVYQFTVQQEQLLSELEDDASEHTVLLGGIVKNVEDHVHSLQTWTTTYLLRLRNDPPRSVPDPRSWRRSNARLIEDPERVARGIPETDLVVANELLPHMRFAHEVMPYLRWSWFLAGDRSFMTLVPVHGRPGRAFDPGEHGLLLLRILDNLPPTAGAAADRSSLGAPAAWSRAFPDPVSGSWMVARQAEVSVGRVPVGTVGSAVLLDFLTGFLRAFDYTAGRTWLVGDGGQILASSEGPVVVGMQLQTLSDVLPADLRPRAAELQDVTSGLVRVGGSFVSSRPISGTDWRLVFLAEAGEVNAVLWPRFVPYAIILAALVLTLLLAHQLRERLIIRPALSLVEFIRAESQDAQAQRPEVPPLWRPWIGAVADAFEAKRQSVEQIRDDAERLRALAGAHPVPLAVVPLDDPHPLYANRAFVELFRMPRDGVTNTHVRDFYAAPDGHRPFLLRLRRRGFVRSFEGTARRLDGTTFPGSITAELVRFDGRDAAVIAVLDLTEQKAAEAEIARQREALLESEQRFKTIAAAHPVPMYILRRQDRRILYASERFAELMRMPLDEVVGSFSLQFYPDPEDRKRISIALRKEGAVFDEEVLARRADGTSFPVAVTARLIDYEGEQAAVFGIVDLTRQKEVEAEVDRQRAALHQSEKLNALGSMLASVAHELNNPLSVVVGYASMMRDLADDPATRDRATRIHAAAERCARIVRTFLAMARRKPESRDAVQLAQVVESALEIAGYGLRTADVAVAVDIEPDLPTIFGDGDQLTLVVTNLIVNAQHALQSVPPPRLLEIRAKRSDNAVVIEIQDNGPGIPPEHLERVFEPFFTTKPQGIGTGIGLSVCRNIVQSHDGQIEVLAPTDKGSLFRISLPVDGTLTDRGEDALPRSSGGTAAPSGRILIVEDEEEVAEMMLEMLQRDGHEVEVARSGRDALSRLGGDPVDLIISDLHMPDLDGPELYRILLERRPGLARRMVMMTGDVLAADATGFLSETGLPVIDKPIDPYDIRIKVKERLEQLRVA